MNEAKLLIVNSDDFGISLEANAAVARMYREDILTSATIMANMPGFDDAAELARRSPSLQLGLHVNLTDGPPVSAPGKLPGLVTSNGLLPGLSGLMVRAPWSQAALRREIAAQIERALSAGIHITHLDSHKHVHVHPAVLAALIWALHEYGIRAVRVPIEPAQYREGTSPGWRMRSALVSMNANRVRRAVQRAGLAATDNFIGTARTCNWTPTAMADAIRDLPPGVTELMVHPDDLHAVASSQVRTALNDAAVRTIGYADISV